MHLTAAELKVIEQIDALKQLKLDIKCNTKISTKDTLKIIDTINTILYYHRTVLTDIRKPSKQTD